jgi:hypothetical protein
MALLDDEELLKSTISATPRNQILGLLSDFIAQGYDPRRTQQMQGISKFLMAPEISQTLDRLSYDPSGRSLFTGAGGLGGTTRMRPEALDAALAVAPMAGRAAQMTKGLPVGASIRNVGSMKFDPRFDPRVKEQPALAALKTDVTETGTNIPKVSLADFEGRPFITSMADRTGVGLLNQINDVPLNRPVNMQGGQGFMFENPGMVWASAKGPSKQILNEAEIIKQVTGQNPLYLPWRMAPTGGDFASMTGESMLAYADAAMNKSSKKRLDKMIKNYIPDWAGVSSQVAPEQFRAAPDRVRKALKNEMDVNFRDAGGLGIGQARLAVSDPAQLASRDAGVMNVGEIFAGQPLVAKSGHSAYSTGVPGQGLGQLQEDLGIFQLMPNVAQARGIPDPLNPRATDIRALQMKPYAGMITEGLLRYLGY